MNSSEAVSTRVLTVPNLVSAARLALVPVFFWLFVTRRNDLLAFGALVLIGGTDWVDGFLARRLKQVSVIGKLLDPVADRIAIIAIVVALTFRGTISLMVAIVILARDAIVSLVFPILEARGYPRIPVNFVGKAATAAIYSGVGLSVLSLLTDSFKVIKTSGSILLWIGAALYWVAGFLYAKELLRIARTRRSVT